MSPTPKRLSLIVEFRARLATIRIVNGFATNAGETVETHERLELGPDDPEVAVAMLFGDDEITAQQQKVAATLPVEIHALAKADLHEPWVMVEQVLGDIKTAIETADQTVAGVLSGRIVRGPTRTVERQPGSSTVGVAITYFCPMTEVWGRPDL